MVTRPGPDLESISLSIEEEEKVGIVGRTSAGNSSIILSFFRMLRRIHGEVQVDSVDVEDVELRELLRSRFAVIPQDAFVFRGTFRQNIDCLGEHLDEAIWAAVKGAKLSRKVDTVEHSLESEVAEGGTNFSEGQRKLLCLARALSKEAKILVILTRQDIKTDQSIQRVIERIASNRTVLTIAHCLDTVVDSDIIWYQKVEKSLSSTGQQIYLATRKVEFSE